MVVGRTGMRGRKGTLMPTTARNLSGRSSAALHATFTARVVASTGSDLTSSVVAAIGALKGPLHGGAPGPVLDMLDAIGAPEKAASWLEGELAAGRRIMGMGHRIYRVRDPRAAVLERAIERLETTGASTQRLSLARTMLKAPPVILLDEPFGELDPDGMAAVEAWIAEERRKGTTIVLATHYLEQGARLADRQVKLAGGRIV